MAYFNQYSYYIKINTIFMNLENNKTSVRYNLALNFAGKKNEIKI